MKSDFQIFQIIDPKKCVLGPGDVFACVACPIFYRFVYHMENVPQTLSDAPYKLFVCMFPSIWQYPCFKNHFKNIEISSKGVSGKSDYLFVLLLPIGPCLSAWVSLGPIVLPIGPGVHSDHVSFRPFI